MNIEFLGGAREIGRSAVLINDSLLLDYGLETSTPLQYPLGEVDPEAIVVSHGHLDHSGAVPSLLTGDSRPPIHWTAPTRALALTLAEDTLKLHGNTLQCPFTETHVRRMTQVSETHPYGESFTAAGHRVTLFNAGHIPGSAHILVDDGETKLLYTGDFKPAKHADERGNPADDEEVNGTDQPMGQRLVDGSTARPEADVVITESTYADVTHRERSAVEQQFVERAKTTLWEGGTVIVPVFAIGRAQELLLVCESAGIDCYLDGMAKEVTQLLRQYPSFVKDADALQRATSNARFVTGRDGQRKRIARKNTVILTTAGMLGGGPVVSYIPEIRQNPTNKIALTGYQVDGTPGRELLDTGRAEFDGRVLPVSAQVEQYNFSAHADREGLGQFLTSYRGSTILVNHGDNCTGFAKRLRENGFDAQAPELATAIVV